MAETFTQQDTRHDPATGARIDYYRGSSGSGRHDITLGTSILSVRPDGSSSGSHRSKVISAALAEIAADRALIEGEKMNMDPMTYLIGALTRAGATNLELTQ